MRRVIQLLLVVVAVLPLFGCSDDDTESACVTLDTTGRRSVIRDYQYARYRFFDLAQISGVNYWTPGDTVIEIILFQSAGVLDVTLPEAVAYPNALDPSSSPDSIIQRFSEVRNLGSDWFLSTGRFYIYFPEPLLNIQHTTIAYYLVVRRPDGSTYSFGDTSGERLRLQMLKRSFPTPSDPLWDAEWKNVYDLGVRNMEYEALGLDIYKGVVGDEDNRANLNHQDGEYFLRLLGLDNFDNAGNHSPDNKVDRNGAILYLEEGLLIFPNRYPFADSLALDHAIPSIYSSLNPSDLRDSSLYYLKHRYELYDLGHRDIVDGSVRVDVNGQPLLNRFGIDEEQGTLYLYHDSAYVTGAQVEVCFEYRK